MSLPPRANDDPSDDALVGRAPAPQATTKIGAFDLEQALARSRARSVPCADEVDAGARPTHPAPSPSEEGSAEVAGPAPRQTPTPRPIVLLAIVAVGALVAAIAALRG